MILVIKAYLASISTQYEGENFEVRYRIFNGDELIVKKSVMLDYIKPALVGHAGLKELLKELDKNKNEQIKIYINDGALYETINGTSRTNNHELVKMAKINRMEINEFIDLEIINVNGNHEQVMEWDQILKP